MQLLQLASIDDTLISCGHNVSCRNWGELAVKTVLWQLPLIGVLFTAGTNAASVPLVNINPATDISNNPGAGQFFGFDETNNNGTWGWRFNVISPIVVTDVGWYDKDADGLFHSHLVGLWKSDGQPIPTYQQLLGTFPPFLTEGITIPSGTAAPLDGPYRKVALPVVPLTLDAGTYILAGTDFTNSPDAIRYGLDRLSPFFPHTMPTDPRIDLGQPGSSQGTGFQVPNLFLLLDGVELGPMLFVLPVPEPSTIALTFTFLGFIYGRRTRIFK